MTSYKLVYFDFKGRAEIIRLLFAFSGKAYEDFRFVDLDEWEKLKETLPFKKLPVLYITDETTMTKGVIPHSHTIVRYLSAKFGLDGKDEIEKSQCDMINEHVRDIVDAIIDVYRMDFSYDYLMVSSIEKEEKLEKLINLQLPNMYRCIQEILEENQNGNGYLVGNSLTYADLVLINSYDWLRERKAEIIDKLPALKQHDEMIRALPRIADHLKKNEKVRLTIYFAD